jgi:hypothetical protein
MKNKTGKKEERISPELAKALGEGDGEYTLSSAFANPSLRRFYGEWEVVEHRVNGQSFLYHFRERTAKDLRAEDAAYFARYIFKESLCAKHVLVQGTLDLPDGEADYSYRMAVALSWGLLPGGVLRVRPELGYHSSFLDGAPVAAGELSTASGAEILLKYRFEDEDLILEEGEDYKRLRKLAR